MTPARTPETPLSLKQPITTEDRARLSAGTSTAAVYNAVAGALRTREVGGVLLDVGCGTGALRDHVRPYCKQYFGADAVRYDDYPSDQTLYLIDLDTGRIPVPDGFADIVTAVEVVEHLENPRALVRELTRVVKPDGWIVITTPNQLSLLSKLTLLIFNEFNAFRAGSYPAHLTALLEVDLRRIAAECSWGEVTTEFTCAGRIPGTSWHWPRWLSKLAPRSLSDNILLLGRKPKG